MSGLKLEESEQGVRVHVPMTFRKRSGRKEIIVPDGADNAQDSRPDYHEAMVVAISRAHRWKKLLDDGRYGSIAEMARALRTNRYCMARMLRLTLLAPDIVETILEGREPDGLSLERLRQPMPMLWEEQKALFGCNVSSRKQGTQG